jgi:SAM-dependent methyltransferase
MTWPWWSCGWTLRPESRPALRTAAILGLGARIIPGDMAAVSGSEGSSSSVDEVRQFALRVWSYKQGEMVALLIHLGDRLGLYRDLAGAGPLEAAEVARRAGLHERWVTEWLRANGAAGLVAWGEDDRFELSEAGAAVLAQEDASLFFAAGAFGAPSGPELVDDLVEAFRSGLGFAYDRQGPAGAHRTERMLGPWTRLALVPRIVPALEGVEAALEAGGTVADLGCGAGLALVALAQRFPKATLHGYDISRHAIERAQELVGRAGLDNVRLHHGGAELLPQDPTFDFALTLDCLHDMTRPGQAIAAIRRALRPEGAWLIKEIRCAPVARDNLVNPLAAMMYGFSITSCMSSALSEPDGSGLGTLGLHPQLLGELCSAAGFSRFEIRDFDEPANLYYEVRP